MGRSKESLQKIVDQGYAAKRELSVIEDAEKMTAHRKLIGKCFSYSNSYSCPQGPGDRWPLYSIVTGVDGSTIETFSFQTCKYGITSIENKGCFSTATLGSEISGAEFAKAWDKQLADIKNIADKALTKLPKKRRVSKGGKK